MKKILYLPALVAAIALVALCSSCGDGVHPPAKKPLPKDTTQKPTPNKVDMTTIQTPVKKMISGILSIISFSLHRAYWSLFFVSLCTVLANGVLRKRFMRLLYGRWGPLQLVQ